MRKMDKVLTASEKTRVWSDMFFQQPDRLTERVQFGALTEIKTLRDAAVLHMRYLHPSTSKALWNFALEMRDNLITELDWEWPHVAFWGEVEKIDQAS